MSDCVIIYKNQVFTEKDFLANLKSYLKSRTLDTPESNNTMFLSGLRADQVPNFKTSGPMFSPMGETTYMRIDSNGEIILNPVDKVENFWKSFTESTTPKGQEVIDGVFSNLEEKGYSKDFLKTILSQRPIINTFLLYQGQALKDSNADINLSRSNLNPTDPARIEAIADSIIEAVHNLGFDPLVNSIEC